MSNYPVNLVLRFMLELTALASLVLWSVKQFEGLLMAVMIVVAPVLFAAIWGIFAVRGDPGRSGKTVVPTRGVFRLFIELGLFTISGVALFSAGHYRFALAYFCALLIHYIISYDRVLWLLKK